jgi:hypothetical protein
MPAKPRRGEGAAIERAACDHLISPPRAGEFSDEGP